MLQRRQLRKIGFCRSILLLRNELLLKRLEEEERAAVEKAAKEKREEQERIAAEKAAEENRLQ